VDERQAKLALQMATPWLAGWVAMIWLPSMCSAWTRAYSSSQFDGLAVARAAREMKSRLEAMERQEAIAALL
jgi:hypothetical protein